MYCTVSGLTHFRCCFCRVSCQGQLEESWNTFVDKECQGVDVESPGDDHQRHACQHHAYIHSLPDVGHLHNRSRGVALLIQARYCGVS